MTTEPYGEKKNKNNKYIIREWLSTSIHHNELFNNRTLGDDERR